MAVVYIERTWCMHGYIFFFSNQAWLNFQSILYTHQSPKIQYKFLITKYICVHYIKPKMIRLNMRQKYMYDYIFKVTVFNEDVQTK